MAAVFANVFERAVLGIHRAKLTGHSNNKWFPISTPQGTSGPVEIGFLNGQEQSTIETGELDFGVAWQDGRYGVENTGVAA